MGPVELSTADGRLTEQLRDVFRAEQVAFRQAHLLAANGVAVELFEFQQPTASEGRARFEYWRTGFSHICVVEAQVDVLADRIVARGGARRTATRPIFPGEPYLFCYCEDPFGNVIEVASHPHSESFGGGRAGY